MLSFPDILYGVALPGVLAAVIMVIARRPWRRSGETGGAWGPPLAIGAGFVAAFVCVIGMPHRFPPRDSNDWVIYFAPVLVVLAVIDALRRVPEWLRAIAALTVALIFTALVLRPVVGESWLSAPEEIWWGHAAAAVFAAWVSLDVLTRRAPGASMPLVMTLVAGCTAVVLATSGSLKLAQLAGALAAACGGVFVIALWVRDGPLARSTAIVFTILWLMLLISGHFFANVTALNARLLYLAPILAWTGEAFAERANPRTRNVARVIAVVIPLAIASVSAIHTFNQ